VILAGFLATFNSVTLLSIRNFWGYIYSSDEAVVAITAAVLPLAALFQVNDCLGAVAGGILRGCGV
jgi:multidrug resistance protein, MATE family